MGSLTADIARHGRVSLCERAGLQLVSQDDVSEFMAAVESSGLVILGIEGFRLDGTEAVPDMRAIADFSEVKSARASVDAAYAFLDSVSDPALYFDFVLDRRQPEAGT